MMMRSLALCLVLAPAAATAQEDDRGYLQGLIEDALSETGREVRITGFTGALRASARLEELTIADADGVWLTLTDAELDWQRAALLRGRLEIDTLSAQSLTLSRLPTTEAPESDAGFTLPELPAPEASRFALPDLPVAIRIGEVSIADVSIGEPVFGAEAQVSLEGSATLEGGEGEVALSVDRTDGRQGVFEIAGSYANSSEILSLSLVLSEAPDGIVVNLVDLPDRPSLDLEVQGEGPISDFSAEIGLRTAGVDRLGGGVTVATTQTDTSGVEQTFAARLNGDLSPLLLPEYRTFFGTDLELEVLGARSDLGGLDIETLALRSSALNIEGQIALGPDSWPLKVDLTGRIDPPDGGTVLLSIPGAETRLDGATFGFSYDVARGEVWDLALAAETVTRDGFALGALRVTGQGRLTPGDGAPVGRADGRITLDLSGLDLGDPALTQAVGAELRGGFAFVLEEEAPFQLSDIALRGADYSLTGAVQIDLPEGRDSPVLTGDLAVDTADLSRFSQVAGQTLGGAARLNVTGDVTPLDGAFDVAIDGTSRDLSIGITQVDALIGGAATLSLRAARDGTGTRIDGLSVRTQQARITGQAIVRSDASEGRFAAQLLDASVLHPDMSGDARLDLTFDQAGQVWTADVTASGPGGARAEIAIRTPEGARTTTATARIEAEDLSSYGWLAARDLAGALSMNASGQFDPETGAGSIAVDGSSRDLSLAIAELDQLLRGTADVTLALRREADGALVVDALTLTAPRLITDLSGSITAERTRFRYNVDLPNMAVLVPDLSGPVAAEGVVMTTGGDWQTDTRLTGPGGMRAEVSGTLNADATRADLSVGGVAPLALANQRLSPNIVSGPLSFDLALRGPLTVSSLSGTMRTPGARLSLPAQKIAFDQIASTIRIGAGRAQIEASLAPSTGGTLRISGPVALEAPFNGDLTIALEALGLSEPGLLESSADGQLRIAGPLTGGAAIAGTITLGEVVVQVPSTSGSTSAALPGLVHQFEPGAVRATRLRAGLVETASGAAGDADAPPYRLDITLSAPSRIFVRGRGLDAEMGGSLRVRGTTRAIAPSGRFDLIRGRLSILGQRLDLTEGYIQPQGDFDPFMRIVAETTTGTADVRFVIEGPVSAPELTMSSSPELPEDEILSRFLFGRDLTQISALQALQIASALATLSGRGGGGAIDRLREGFGLDDLDVSTSETGQTTVRAGKYISENVYSDVAQTAGGETEINLNLTLTPSLTARGTARSDSSTGVGIYFERDY